MKIEHIELWIKSEDIEWSEEVIDFLNNQNNNTVLEYKPFNSIKWIIKWT